ncbi:hypothetical protein [Mesobacillus jeotgali]|uniref:hypothetical protein n=1 Tax=Mesobacillus jeotgali TaxID=129985 RepID=UPI0013158CB7|nr:hypothetical protein [Mesobacillus jeotgali]
MSEVKPGSDKTTPQAREIVRSHAVFGQNYSSNKRFCLTGADQGAYDFLAYMSFFLIISQFVLIPFENG